MATRKKVHPEFFTEPGPKSWDWSIEQAEVVLVGMANGEKPRQIAQPMGLTSRHVYALMHDLLQAGVIELARPAAERRGRPWRNDVGYTMAHARVRLARGGPARNHNCKECGDPAIDWAYSNSCPNELVSENGLRYSLDVTQYDPLCKGCHARRDAAYRRSA